MLTLAQFVCPEKTAERVLVPAATTATKRRRREIFVNQKPKIIFKLRQVRHFLFMATPGDRTAAALQCSSNVAATALQHLKITTLLPEKW
jgi:hypothetical protein